MEIKVCGMGVVSSLGVGCAANLDALLEERCGLDRLTLFASAIEVPVGEVKFSNAALKQQLGVSVECTVSRTALLGALAAKEAVMQAQIAAGSRVGLISSTTVGGMDLSEQFYESFHVDSKKGRLRNVVGHDCSTSTSFIADCCQIEGFQTTLSTACSSAANAIMMGADMLRADMLDYVIVGGVDALCRFTLNGFNSLQILDKELCKPLDAHRKGLNLGEGAGYLVLTNKKECNHLCGYLTGYANANDAFHQTASSDDGEGAYLAMKASVERAQIGVEEIDYINMHGTGTGNNDASEWAAVKRLFGTKTPPFSSTKSFTGHTLAAAGGVEAVFALLAIKEGVRYANLRFNQPMEEGSSPLLHTERNVRVKHVLSNSFGFGGNCSSLIFSAESTL
ncbi:MAG: beta-ketoacyl-[acyl-carrier-protein] synthase family protein [Phocaeicola sp.]